MITIDETQNEHCVKTNMYHDIIWYATIKVHTGSNKTKRLQLPHECCRNLGAHIRTIRYAWPSENKKCGAGATNELCRMTNKNEKHKHKQKQTKINKCDITTNEASHHTIIKHEE